MWGFNVGKVRSEKHILLTWITPRTDKDQETKCHFPDDHPEWPGAIQHSTHKEYPDNGPTLDALFNPNSPVQLAKLDKAVLFFTSDKNSKSCVDFLKNSIDKFQKTPGRKNNKFGKIICEEMNVKNPVDPEEIHSALDTWVKNPSEEFQSPSNWRDSPKHLHIILSSGTPAMYATWLVIYWQGIFSRWGSCKTSFYQGEERKNPACTEEELAKRRVLIEIDCDFINSGCHTTKPSSYPMEQMRDRRYGKIQGDIEKAARLGLSVLLIGPRGVGKTTLAEDYHKARRKTNKPGNKGESNGKLVTVVMSEHDRNDNQDFRHEMFGTNEGYFTGQKKGNTKGKIEEADNGTLFLDEVHHMTKNMQIALLGPLNGGKFHRVGQSPGEGIQTDFALISATNLEEDKFIKKMAPDFLDRIRNVQIRIPSFAEIRETQEGAEDLWGFLKKAIKDRFEKVGINKGFEPGPDCENLLREFLRNNPLQGNWRDLYKLADQLLFHGPETGEEFLWREECVRQAIESNVFPVHHAGGNP